MSVVCKKDRGRMINRVLLAVSLVFAIGLCEGILRVHFADLLVVYEEERALLYRYDPKLGWFPRENSVDTYTGSQTISVLHNSRGFRDNEHHPSEKPGLLFIGDSFVWGYDVDATDRFTEKLRPRLPEWDVYNLGISGYSTDQELLMLMDQYEYYRPRIVFLVYCTYNDEMENSFNNIFQGMYYKPYFDIRQNMALKGVPVPKSLSYFGREHPVLVNSYVARLIMKAFAPPLVAVANPTRAIIQRMKEFVESKGGLLVVGMTEPHGTLEPFFKNAGIPYVQLDGADRFPAQGWHWTPAGHTTISTVIYDFLQKQQLLRPAKESRN